MLCNNVSCRYYKPPKKRDYFEKYIGVTHKQGGCKYPWCKLQMKGNKSLKR